MIPQERALVCSHPAIIELPLLNLRYREIGCTACGQIARMPIPYTPVNEDYGPACIAFAFGTLWGERVWKQINDRKWYAYRAWLAEHTQP